MEFVAGLPDDLRALLRSRAVSPRREPLDAIARQPGRPAARRPGVAADAAARSRAAARGAGRAGTLSAHLREARRPHRPRRRRQQGPQARVPRRRRPARRRHHAHHDRRRAVEPRAHDRGRRPHRRHGLPSSCSRRTPTAPADEGNLLLDRLFGARVHFVPSVDPMLAVGLDEEKVREVEAGVRARGGVPYVIPVGGSSGVGALGYVAGTLELCGQLEALGVAPTRLYFASGSRGTQAGLTLGAHLCAAPYRLHGIAVSAGEAEKVRARPPGRRAKRPRCSASTTRCSPREFVTDQSFIGDGYGIPTPEGLEAHAARGPHRSPGARSHLHGQGDGGARSHMCARVPSTPGRRWCSCTRADRRRSSRERRSPPCNVRRDWQLL